MTIRLTSLSPIAIVSVLAATMPAAAQETTLQGQTVEFVIPFSESGGSSQWANFFAPLLSESLPGNPNVVVRYRPGAGSTAGANWFASQSTPNGSLVFGTSGSTQFPFLLEDPRVRYDYADWQVVLASGTGGVVYLPPELAEGFDGDMSVFQDEFFLYGSQGATTLDLVPLLAFDMLGLQVDPVFGVEGRGDGRLMFERGEANIDYQTTAAYLANVQPLVDEGLAVPIFTWGSLGDDGEIIRDPTFPDLPTFAEICEATEGCETEGVAWDAWRSFFVSGFAAQKMVYLPGAAPQEVVDMYTAAFDEIVARDDFAEISEETLGIYPQATGQAAINANEAATTITPEAKQYVLDWLEEDYGVTF